MQVERAAHCTYRIRYHMVMCVMYRKKMLLEKSRIEFLKEIMQGLASSYYCGTAGHVSAEVVAKYIRENSGKF